MVGEGGELAGDQLLRLVVAAREEGTGSPRTWDAFSSWASSLGLVAENRNGVIRATDPSGRIRGWIDARAPRARFRRTNELPCATCGALPVGAYHDGSPRYACGPHDPVAA